MVFDNFQSKLPYILLYKLIFVDNFMKVLFFYKGNIQRNTVQFYEGVIFL